jgi:hypothetical protein
MQLPLISRAIRGASICAATSFYAPPAVSQVCRDTAGFVRIQGADTLVLERSEFTKNAITGVQQSPSGFIQYRVSLDSRFQATEGAFSLWLPGQRPPAAPTQQADFAIERDTAIVSVRSGARSQQQRNGIASGSILLLDVSVGLEEAITRRARLEHKKVVVVPVYYVASAGYAPSVRVSFEGSDSVRIQFGNDDVVADLRIDADGRILGGKYKGARDPNMVIVARVSCADIDLLLSRHPPSE